MLRMVILSQMHFASLGWSFRRVGIHYLFIIRTLQTWIEASGEYESSRLLSHLV